MNPGLISPWSEWGNCEACGTPANRRRVRTCTNVVPPLTGAALAAAIAADCPAAPSTVGNITTVGFETDPVTNVWTQTQIQSGVCTGTAGPIAGTPYTDTCNVGKSFIIIDAHTPPEIFTIIVNKNAIKPEKDVPS